MKLTNLLKSLSNLLTISTKIKTEVSISELVLSGLLDNTPTLEFYPYHLQGTIGDNDLVLYNGEHSGFINIYEEEDTIVFHLWVEEEFTFIPLYLPLSTYTQFEVVASL